MRVTRTNGAETVLKEAVVEAFRATLRGELLTPDAADYDEALAQVELMLENAVFVARE